MKTIKEYRNVAVVLAGGSGERMGTSMPKQFLRVAGKPVIKHTVGIFQSSDDIDEIIIMVAEDYIPDAKKIVAEDNFAKVSKIIKGGKTRNDTTRRALDAIEGEECNVLFHDAVRPLLSQRIIRQCVNALKHYEAVDVAIPSADTIIEVEKGTIQSIPERARLMRGQTPQAFRLSTIRKAYDIAQGDKNFQATDDCGVVLKYLPEVPIFVVEGSEQNMKITHPIDIYLADRLFQLSSASAQQHFDDTHRREHLAGRTMIVFGGSYGIGADIAKLAKKYDVRVFSYSRSVTKTHVENEGDVKKALEAAYKETGRIDYVINTAGLLNIGALAETDTKTVEEMIKINYIAPVKIAQLSLPYLRKTKGQLLLFTSSSYTRGRADYSLYSSSKAAVVNLTQALADEWSSYSVKINCVNPERTATPMRKKAFGNEDPSSLLASEAVAQASIDTLISDFTGQVIDVRKKN